MGRRAIRSFHKHEGLNMKTKELKEKGGER